MPERRESGAALITRREEAGTRDGAPQRAQPACDSEENRSERRLVLPTERRFGMTLSRRAIFVIALLIAIVALVVVLLVVYSGGGGGGGGGGY